MSQSQSQSQPQAQTKLQQLKETISSLRRRLFETRKLVTIVCIICYVGVLTLMLSLVWGKPNGFVFIIGVIGSFIQLHYLVLISTRSLAARCQSSWAGFVRMLGQKSILLNLSVVALCSSEGSIKYKVFIGLIVAINEIVHVLWPLMPPSYKSLVEPWKEYHAQILLFIGISLGVLTLVSPLFTPEVSFFGMWVKILVPMMLWLPHKIYRESYMECLDENCRCRIYSPTPATSLSQGSYPEVSYTYVNGIPHEKCQILNEKMSLCPALVLVVFSVAALAFVSITAGSTIEHLSEKLVSWSSGPLIILFMVDLLFQQISSITPGGYPILVFGLQVVCLLGLSGMFISLLSILPTNGGIVGASVWQYIFVACLLWSEAHEAFYRCYRCKDPAEWGKYVIMSCLLVIWTNILDVLE